MTAPRSEQLFTRYPGNPILSPEDWPYTVNAVFNPGATVGPDGETLLLVRVEDRSGISHLTLARSDDGVTNWKIDSRPTLMPQTSRVEELWGIEDPANREIRRRVPHRPHGGVERRPAGGSVVHPGFPRIRAVVDRVPPENKDASLFPVKFDGRYAMIHRPVFYGYRAEAHMWISFSPDLRHWGDHKILLESRHSVHWDQEKIGLGPPPLWTNEGWLIMFHGVKGTAAGALYRAGLAVLTHTSRPVSLPGPTNGCWARRPTRREPATCRESCSRVAGSGTTTTTRSACTTGRRTHAWDQPPRGWTIFWNSCSHIQCESAGECGETPDQRSMPVPDIDSCLGRIDCPPRRAARTSLSDVWLKSS